MSYGLKGKVKEIVTQMNALREAGENTDLRSFIGQNYSDANKKPLQPEHLFAELDINPQRTRVHQLFKTEDTKYLASEIVVNGINRGMGLAQREQAARLRESFAKLMVAQFGPITGEHAGGQRFISPEVFMAPINRGAVQGAFYPDLIVGEERVDQPQVVMPLINLSDAKLMDGAEAATIEEGSISYGTKTVALVKKGRAIKQTYESVEYSSLSMLQWYMEDVGRILGHSLNGLAVDAIINGDQTDTSEAAAVIGVESTGNGITWYDITRVAIQFGLLGRTATQVIGNATTALNYLNLPEVKNKQNLGAATLPTTVKSPLTMPEELYVSTKVGASKIVIQDPSASLVQLTSRPLLVETEKIVMKQLFGTVASIQTGFAKIQRNASIVIDGSILFSGNGFPAWMQPFAG